MQEGSLFSTSSPAFIVCNYFVGVIALVVVLRGLSLVAVSRGYSLLWCAGFQLQRLLWLEPRLWGTQASVVVAPGL